MLDYGSGNLRSAERALVRVGADVTVTVELAAARAADGLVVPGVGAYAACMSGIDQVRAAGVIRERVAAGRPVLGICVGMQMLFERGVEHGVQTLGLGLLSGSVTRLAAPVLPHMGWNTVDAHPCSQLLAGIGAGERFYFVHSYAGPPTVAGATVSTSCHGEPFAAVVEAGPLAATQFHPEKSGDIGAHLLATWLEAL